MTDGVAARERIALVTCGYPVGPEDPSGHFVQSEAHDLAAGGWDVHVVGPGRARPPSPAASDSALQIAYHGAGGGNLFGWPGVIARLNEDPRRLAHALPFVLRARAALRRIRPTRVIAHWAVPSALPVSVGLCDDVEAVFHGADVRLLVASPAPIRALLLERLLATCVRFRFVSTTLRTALCDAAPAELRPRFAEARVAPCSVRIDLEPAETAACDARFGAREGPRIALVGRLVEGKRFDLGLRAVAELGDKRMCRGRPKVVVVGDGPLRSALEEQAQRLGLDVVFAGRTGPRQAQAWMAASDVLLHPSGTEGASLVVREARAVGLAAIVCEAGDNCALAEEDGHIFIALAHPEALAKAMARALDRPPPRSML